MKRLTSALAALLILAAAQPALAADMQFTLTPAGDLKPGVTTHVTAHLARKDGTPVTLAMLKEVHTKKLHLLVVDPSLTDYHHLHPEATDKPGDYRFDFTPHLPGQYRVWADVTDAKTGAHEYLEADMGATGNTVTSIDETPSLTSDAGGLHFALTLDEPLKVGEAAMVSLTVTKDGKPFTGLEPVMGAFAHVVGFGEDYHSILHIHPMGKEPTKATERGGPALMFHLEPEHAGFVKLFAQVRVNGQDIFAPFGLTVAPQAAKAKPHAAHHHE